MIERLLQPEIREFIRAHEHEDVNVLLLKHQEVAGVRFSLIADQIKGRVKARFKLPEFYAEDRIIYPPGINLEQSSSEETATFKNEILKQELGRPLKSVADLTGGFGVDSYFISKITEKVYYIEPNHELLQIVLHNHNILPAGNIIHESTTAEKFLDTNNEHFDLVYIDPSRRSKGGSKVITLDDAEPNIIKLQTKIFEKTERLLLKSSPLLDISLALRQILHVKIVFVVSVDNECKEVLFYSVRDFKGEPVINAVNLARDKSEFTFRMSEEKQLENSIGPVDRYLYEPNASILKAGAFKSVGVAFDFKKLHVSTHLYTSSFLRTDFPGRIFNVISEMQSDADLKSFFPENKANVTTRNYPLTVEQIKKKMRLKDGGDKYLIGLTDSVKKKLMVADRIK